MKSVGKFQEIIVYFANGLIFWFPARLDETLDHGFREDGIGSKATAEIGPCIEIGSQGKVAIQCYFAF